MTFTQDFLRHFTAYCVLEAELRDMAARMALAEDQARLWRSRADSSEIRERQTTVEKDRIYKMICNCEAVRTGSPIVPFPDVYVPMPEPPRDEGEIPEPRKRRASELVKDMEREFAAEYGAQLDRELG